MNMAKAIQLSSAKNISTLKTPLNSPNYRNSICPQFNKLITSAKKIEPSPLIAKRVTKSSRRAVTIPATAGRWPGKWTCEYAISLKDLQLHDLAEDGRFGTEVLVSLSLQKHTGFGLSVDGRVMTIISRKCPSCSSPYNREIDASISVWVLPDDGDDTSTIPEIGGDDPSVIYVKPGCEADLDSLIQDTVRLQVAVKETCSEQCEKSEPKLHYIGAQKTASLDQRWSQLSHLKKRVSKTI